MMPAKRLLALIGLSLGLLVACSSPSAEPIVVPTRFILPTDAAADAPLSEPLSPTSPSLITASDTPVPTPTLTPSPPPPSPTPTEQRQASPTFSPTPSSTATLGATATLTPAPSLAPQSFGTLSSQIDQAGVVRTIADLVNFETRHTNAIRGDGWRGIDAARSYLSGRLNAISSTCAGNAVFYEDQFSVVYRETLSTQSNLILAVNGTNSSNEVLIVGAHYDTMSEFQPHQRQFLQQPGANDNGSGVAAVLELARLICLQPQRETMVFVLFAAEEIRTEAAVGRVGSRHFVSTFMPAQGWRTRAMLNLDTIGSAIDSATTRLIEDRASLYSAGPNTRSRQLARQIQAAAYVQMPDYRLNIEDREDRRNRWGDHMSFTEAGWPAARLIEGAEDSNRQDTPEDKMNYINPSYLVKNIRVGLAFLLSYSEGAATPQNISINGGIVIWDAVPEVQGYLVGSRRSSEHSYTFTLLPADRTGIELSSDTYFAVGSIGANGILGLLSAESYIP